MTHITRALVLATALCSGFVTLPASAQETMLGEVFPAVLAGHSVIPALTLIVPPADAPADAWVSGKFTVGATRVDQPMSVEGDTGGLHGRRGTGIFRPFIGQPMQGFSGFAMNRAADGSIYSITDNGFGSKANSPDTLLFFHRVMPNFEDGRVDVRETVFLHDPDGVVPFAITYQGTQERYLTGADFDLESIQVIGDDVWIGEEFGPYLIRATLDGRVTGVYPTLIDGVELRSPDHPALGVPAQPGTDFLLPRSSGYEGMALQPGTGLLWGMLEKPLLNADGTSGPRVLEVLAFDPSTQSWTGDRFLFPLGEGATAIGDFNFIDETRALVIKRDNGEGDPSLACADPANPTPDCFPSPALLKRVVLIDTAQIAEDGTVRRLGYIDLMNIADPQGLSRLETVANRDLSGLFTMPFFTIEDVMLYDETHILVATDNNLPFSSGRQLDAAMDNEFVLLSVPELLSAR